jgi:hypothetical protein
MSSTTEYQNYPKINQKINSSHEEQEHILIEIKHDSHTTEVTALSPSFDLN